MDQGPGRDLVREFVEAARAEGLRVGFYYSLMDWHHPDGAICKTDEAARRRFVDYTHGLIRELMTNYGKIDILWYDVAWPLDRRAVGIGAHERDGLLAAARDHREQPQPAARRLLHARAAHPGRRGGPRLGNLHDAERELGLQPRRRCLEDAQDHRRQPDHLRARRRKLSAQHRSRTRRLRSAGVGRDPRSRGQMARHERQGHLRYRAR